MEKSSYLKIMKHVIIWLQVLILVQRAELSSLREKKSITWAEILKGKSGYPKISIQGYPNNIKASDGKYTTQAPEVELTSPVPNSFLEEEYITERQTTPRPALPLFRYTTPSSYRSSTNKIATFRPFYKEKDSVYDPPQTTATSPKYVSTTKKIDVAQPVYVNSQPVYTTKPDQVSPSKYMKTEKPNYFKQKPINSQIDQPGAEKNTKDNIQKYDFNQYGDYDESFFKNDYYEYLDSEEINEVINEPVPETGNIVNNSTQNRRALDFLYHMLIDPTRHSPAKRRPFLIEEIFQTIDKHVIEDVAAWSQNSPSSILQNPEILSLLNNLPSLSKPKSTTPPTIELPPISGNGKNSIANLGFGNLIPSTPEENAPQTNNLQYQAPQQGNTGVSVNEGPVVNSIVPDFTGDEFVVVDEFGKQHVVSINNIITSLAQLNENEISNILLGNPAPGDTPININDIGIDNNQNVNELQNTNIDGTAIPNNGQNSLPEQPLNNVGVGQNSLLQQPLNNVGVGQNSLLQQSLNVGVPLPTQQVEPETNNIGFPLLSVERPTRQIINEIPNTEQTFLIGNKEGGVQVVAMSEILDYLKTHDNGSPLPSQPDEIDEDTLLSLVKNIPGSKHLGKVNTNSPTVISKLVRNQPVIKTDHTGNNIILSLAKPGQSGIIDLRDEHTNYVSPTKFYGSQSIIKGKDPLVELNETPKEDKPSNGHQSGQDVFDFLFGGPENLPRPIRSSQSTKSNINTIPRHPTKTINPIEYIEQNPVLQPEAAPSTQQDLSSILSSLVSRLTGHQDPSNLGNQNIINQQTQPKEDVVRLVVKQQNRNKPDEIFGHVNIALPKPIHYRENTNKPITRRSFIPSNTNRRNLNTNDKGDTFVPQQFTSLVKDNNIPTKVVEFLIKQQNDKPTFKIPKDNVQVDEGQSRNDDSYTSYVYSDDTVSYHDPYQSYVNPPVDNGGPLFSLDFLADLIKVEKIGKKNHSFQWPKIGDSSKFVNTYKHLYSYK